MTNCDIAGAPNTGFDTAGAPGTEGGWGAARILP